MSISCPVKLDVIIKSNFDYINYNNIYLSYYIYSSKNPTDIIFYLFSYFY